MGSDRKKMLLPLYKTVADRDTAHVFQQNAYI